MRYSTNFLVESLIAFLFHAYNSLILKTLAYIRPGRVRDIRLCTIDRTPMYISIISSLCVRVKKTKIKLIKVLILGKSAYICRICLPKTGYLDG